MAGPIATRCYPTHPPTCYMAEETSVGAVLVTAPLYGQAAGLGSGD